MAGTAADPFNSSGRVLHLGRVDQLRVRVAFGPALGGPALDVFLLDVALEAVDTFDEDPYLADWVRSAVNALVRRDVEGRIAVPAPTEGLHLTQPCSPTVESVVSLVPDVVVILDAEAGERIAAWLDLGSRGAFIELTEDTTRDIELVSAPAAPAGGRLRARIGRGVRPDDLARLTRELAAGPDG